MSAFETHFGAKISADIQPGAQANSTTRWGVLKLRLELTVLF